MTETLSILAKATSNAIKAAHAEFKTAFSSPVPSKIGVEPKSPLPQRLLMLNDPSLLQQKRETFLDAS